MTAKSKCLCGNWDTIGLCQRRVRCTKCGHRYTVHTKVVIHDVLEPPHMNPRTGKLTLGAFI